MINSIQRFDMKLLCIMDKNLRCKKLDKLMPAITVLGNGGAVWIVISFYLFLSGYYRYEAYMVITSLLLVTIIGEGIIKHLIKRARPFTNVKQGRLLISAPITYSFPSGHSASSFAAAGIFLMTGSTAGIFVVILAALIAFSRVYLNVHYPSDVLTGVILGLLCSAAVVYIFN